MFYNVTVNDDGSLLLVRSETQYKNATEYVLAFGKKGTVQPEGLVADCELFGALPGAKVAKAKGTASEWLALKEAMNAPLPVIDRSEFLAFQAWKASQAVVVKVA